MPVRSVNYVKFLIVLALLRAADVRSKMQFVYDVTLAAILYNTLAAKICS